MESALATVDAVAAREIMIRRNSKRDFQNNNRNGGLLKLQRLNVGEAGRPPPALDVAKFFCVGAGLFSAPSPTAYAPSTSSGQAAGFILSRFRGSG